jgi:hypothetical protein
MAFEMLSSAAPSRAEGREAGNTAEGGSGRGGASVWRMGLRELGWRVRRNLRGRHLMRQHTAGGCAHVLGVRDTRRDVGAALITGSLI